MKKKKNTRCVTSRKTANKELCAFSQTCEHRKEEPIFPARSIRIWVLGRHLQGRQVEEESRGLLHEGSTSTPPKNHTSKNTANIEVQKTTLWALGSAVRLVLMRTKHRFFCD